MTKQARNASVESQDAPASSSSGVSTRSTSRNRAESIANPERMPVVSVTAPDASGRRPPPRVNQPTPMVPPDPTQTAQPRPPSINGPNRLETTPPANDSARVVVQPAVHSIAQQAAHVPARAPPQDFVPAILSATLEGSESGPAATMPAITAPEPTTRTSALAIQLAVPASVQYIPAAKRITRDPPTFRDSDDDVDSPNNDSPLICPTELHIASINNISSFRTVFPFPLSQ